MNRLENQWFEATVYAAHQGSGKYVPTVKYVFAPDAISALDGVNKLNGWKRAKLPTIKPMSPEKASLLERIIPEYTNLTIPQARQKGVHASRLGTDVDLSEILQQMLAQQEIIS